MSKKFKDIKSSFPDTYQYSSDSDRIPLEFYESTFPIANNIDLLLGYFSSNAIKVLSKSMAEFLYTGGSMRIITNHYYTLADYENLILNPNLNDEDKVVEIFKDVSEIERNLSKEGQHFFDCLKYLMKHERLQILPVLFDNVSLAHSKTMILYDGTDYIATEGSINFTLSALIRNSEKFLVEVPWNGDVSRKRIKETRENFNLIFDKKHPDYKYIDKDKIEVVINSIGRDKDIQDLLNDSLELTKGSYSDKVNKIIEFKKKRFINKIEQIKYLESKPHFPKFDGKISKPREYQEEAYKAWVGKDYSGVFAMATGTGKTITSLNCLLNLYNEEGTYRAIILVPSITLLNQWEEEVKAFNFQKIIKVGGGNNWERNFANYVSDHSWGLKDDLIIISTYGSFILDRFQRLFFKIQKDFLLIADEAHSMGANNIKSKLNDLNIVRKIGLSATPKRIYDPEGTLAIDKFFKDRPPYTYNFSMKKALEKDYLTDYKYYPIIIELTDKEFEEYVEISKKLLKFFDFEKGVFKDNPIVEILLLKRKSIIHKAYNKLEVFNSIIHKLKKNNKNKYIFAYIPEGYGANEEGDTVRVLNEYLLEVNKEHPDLKMNSYTAKDKNLDEILMGFEEGKIDLLFAMKMLDEGVDVPRAEIGIFVSSTGNPRQFIQRRGRLLRKHKDKAYATIFDMIVIPRMNNTSDEFFTIEKNLVRNELNRVAYFASLAMNFYDSKDSLENVCIKYGLDLDNLINDL